MSNVRIIGEANLVARISQTFDEYNREAYNIFKWYAGEAATYFAREQTSLGPEARGEFWTNHTMKAAEAFFTKAWQVPGRMGVSFAYTKEPWYTSELEEEFGGKYAALPKIMARFYPLIMRDLAILYGDS